MSFSVAAAIALGLISAIGGYAANKALQEDSQEHQFDMSNTAYQRGVADMEAAGLNPNLLLSNGGAAVTGSSSANSSRESAVTSAITNYAVNSALSKQNYEQQLWLQNDKQAFLREMADNKVNSAKTNSSNTYNWTYTNKIREDRNSRNLSWFETFDDPAYL